MYFKTFHLEGQIPSISNTYCFDSNDTFSYNIFLVLTEER